MTSMVNKLSLGLGVALFLSVLGHVLGAYVYLQQRDALAITGRDLELAAGDSATARAAAASCSASVEALGASAAIMASQLEAAREAANKNADTHNARADKILATPASVPGDACASAQKRVDAILASRIRKGGG